MPISTLIFQGLNQNCDHLSSIRNMLYDQTASKFIISVAYARVNGVEQLRDLLLNNNNKITAYVGIANGVTSYQALYNLLSYGVNVFGIHMGSDSRIYHPKIYSSISQDKMRVIVGSANLTFSGLNENVEISCDMTLDNNEPNERKNINDIINTFSNLDKNFPNNVFHITDEAILKKMLNEGHLENELIKKSANITGHSTTYAPNAIIIPPFPKFNTRQRPLRRVIENNFTQTRFGEAWKSKALTERDLNIPKALGTNPTGSMFFNKGQLENIDQRHYFRDIVFGNLGWNNDTSSLSKMHLERAFAYFEIIINGTSYGEFKLKLTHDSRTDSPSYLQRNSMTQVHWGEAKPLVSRVELLGKIAVLYHVKNDHYQLSIN
ncbi:phospholipase D family protein [Klebsiella pneumoniae]|nr:phospholipase D family protein [Klebsiella pneumoniae]SSK94719.1 Predicted HKD family nuclease [Klebsiella pneumoniae]